MVPIPFRSERQRRFLWLKHPQLARRWAERYGSKPRPSSTLKSKGR